MSEAGGRTRSQARARKRRAWALPERLVTPESAYLNRRAFLKALGAAGAASAATVALPALAGCPGAAVPPPDEPTGGATLSGWEEAHRDLYPAARSERTAGVGRDPTPEGVSGRYNNFYEFTTDKERVWRLVDQFVTRPWEVEVSGLCERPGTFDLDDLARVAPLEERTYRLRCVEAWAAVIPWTGYPLARLLEHVGARPEARFVRFVSFDRPDQAPGRREQTWYPWPYVEGLTIDEARHDLALLTFGIYGHPLTKQHGAPVRIVLPWKYGFKSAKSIVSIELVAERPRNFWNVVVPGEYDFFANVDPATPHPRWSQASERDIATGERRPTLPWNGYGDEVERLYRAE